MSVSAVSAEIVDGTLPVKRFSPRSLRHNVPIHTLDSAETPHGSGGAHRKTSLVSAVMPARIGPVKPFLNKALPTDSEACGRTERAANAQPGARAARNAPHRREPGRAWGCTST